MCKFQKFPFEITMSQGVPLSAFGLSSENTEAALSAAAAAAANMS